MRLSLVLCIVLSVVFTCDVAFGCKCVAPPPGLNSELELARWRAQRATAIFEGTAESAELESSFLKARVGDVVPADLDQDVPSIVVTFSISRSYRGAKSRHVKVETGLGGGDCGFDFEIGRQYLVYADKGQNDRLTTGICTATALLDDSQGNLAYLRDNATVPKGAKNGSVKVGKLCIRVTDDPPVNSADERILLFRVGSTSPIGSDEAESDGNGLFCANSIERGMYRLLFERRIDETLTSFAYYPGVSKLSDAAVIKVESGQRPRDLVFNVLPQPTFSVKGMVLTSNNSPLPPESKAILISADQPFLSLVYYQDVAPNGSFTFPKVLAGRYWSFVDANSEDDGSHKWSIRKGELLVDGNLAGITLTLIPE